MVARGRRRRRPQRGRPATLAGRDPAAARRVVGPDRCRRRRRTSRSTPRGRAGVPLGWPGRSGPGLLRPRDPAAARRPTSRYAGHLRPARALRPAGSGVRGGRDARSGTSRTGSSPPRPWPAARRSPPSPAAGSAEVVSPRAGRLAAPGDVAALAGAVEAAAGCDRDAVRAARRAAPHALARMVDDYDELSRRTVAGAPRRDRLLRAPRRERPPPPCPCRRPLRATAPVTGLSSLPARPTGPARGCGCRATTAAPATSTRPRGQPALGPAARRPALPDGRDRRVARDRPPRRARRRRLGRGGAAGAPARRPRRRRAPRTARRPRPPPRLRGRRGLVAAWPREAHGHDARAARQTRGGCTASGRSRAWCAHGPDQRTRVAAGSSSCPAGAGGHADGGRASAARGRRTRLALDVLGATAAAGSPTRRLLAGADVVVTHAGQNALADVAAARRPAVVVPAARPHDEQQTTGAVPGRRLAGRRAARWPDADGWAGVLDRAADLDPRPGPSGATAGPPTGSPTWSWRPARAVDGDAR